jgi:hypothetical protein
MSDFDLHLDPDRSPPLALVENMDTIRVVAYFYVAGVAYHQTLP